jgi:hypothetical protein
VTVPISRAIEANTPGALATTNQVTVIGRIPYAGSVTAVTYIPSSSVAAPASGTGRTYTVFNRGNAGGTGTVSVASRSQTSNVALTADAPFDLTLGTSAALACTSGDVLEFNSTALTSNAPDPGGRVVVTFARS